MRRFIISLMIIQILLMVYGAHYLIEGDFEMGTFLVGFNAAFFALNVNNFRKLL